MLRPFFYIVLLTLIPFWLTAQTRQYTFTRISVKEGLASNRVYSILQDKKGFIWLGTANGLQRFDGRKLIMFRPPATPGNYLPATGIHQIFADRQNNFWVRSDAEVGIFDPVTFRYKKAIIHSESEIPPRSEFRLWRNNKGNVFLIITNHEVLVYDSATNTFRKNNGVIRLPKDRKASHLFEDRETGFYWMGTDSGLAVYDPRSKEVYCSRYNPHNITILSDPALQAPVTAMFIDRKRRFWIATWDVLKTGERFFCYDLHSGRCLEDTSGLRPSKNTYKELHGFFQQSGGRLWAFGLMMFLEYDPVQHRFHYLRNDHIDDYGIRYDQVFCVYEDNEANLWIGTDQGVYVFNPGREKFNSVFTVNRGRNAVPVHAFLELPHKGTLVSTWGGGVITYDSNFVRTPNSILSNAPAGETSWYMQWALCRESKTGKIWIGCQDGGVIIYDPATGQSRFYNLPVMNKRTVRQIVEDHHGNIWLGSQYGRLVRWDGTAGYGAGFLKGFSLVHQFNTIINKLYCGPHGQLWVTTHKRGLYTINPLTGDIAAHYHTKNGAGRSLWSDQVIDVLQVTDSLVFITAGALHILNRYTGSIQIISAEEGLPSTSPNNLQQDTDGNLWIGLLNGLCRYNYKRNTFTQFTPRDGLIQENFLSGIKLQSGKMLFGNTHGFVHFNPKMVLNNADPPLDVTITDFKLFNTYLPPDSIMKLDKVRLHHSENSLTIEFAALSFLQRDKIVYYYKMDGLNEDWVRTDRILAANYTLLPPGEYTFNVMCENADGLDSENITRLVIYIKPPFWRTWWFISLVAIAIAALIYMMHRLRVHRLLAMEKVRTRIARDLHDDMGSTLSTINILSTMARMKAKNDTAKTEEYLDKISDNSSRMMDAMDDIVWSINPMNDNMQRITARMREFATGVLEARNIDFAFRVDEQVQDLKLDMEARRDLFLIFKEAVNNLAKYAQCRRAEIDISIQKNKLLLKIKDDGIGFDVANSDGGNGLTNMQKRAQSLKGRLTIDSIKMGGTRVALEVPLT